MPAQRQSATKLVLPAPELTVGSDPKALGVLHRDWRRIEREVAATQESWPPFTQVATASLGIAVSAFLGWMQWGSVYDSLTSAGKAANYWQGSFLGIATFACIAVAVAMSVAEWSMRHRKSSLRSLTQLDMAEIFDAATKTEGLD